MANVNRFSGQAPSRGIVAAVFVIVSMALFGIFLGLVTSAFPPSFVAKLGFLLMGLVIIVAAVFSMRWGRIRSREELGRRILFVWLFMLGAFPWYLPFKFGPLPGLNPVRLCFMLLLALLALDLFSSSEARARVKQRLRDARGTFVVLLLFVSWLIVCSFTSTYPLASLDHVVKVWLHGLVIFFAVLVFVRGPQDMMSALKAIVLGAVVASIVAVIEWRMQANVFARFFPSGEAQDGIEWILLDKSRLGAYRASGTAAHPLALAEYLAATLPCALYLLLGNSTRRWRWIAAFALPMMLLGLYLTHTRTATVAGAFASVTMLFGIAWSWIRNRDQSFGKALSGWFGLIFTVALALSVVVVAQVLLEGRNRVEASSTNARIVMLKGTQRLVERSPIFGYGPGLAAETLNHRAPSGVLTIDSYYMSVSIEAGLVGLGLFVALGLCALGRVLRRGLGAADDAWLFRVAMAGGIVAMLTTKIGLSLTHNFALMLMLLAGSIVMGGSAVPAPKRKPVSRPRTGVMLTRYR